MKDQLQYYRTDIKCERQDARMGDNDTISLQHTHTEELAIWNTEDHTTSVSYRIQGATMIR